MDARTSRYHEVYARAQRDPQGFWAEAAQEIDWIEPAKQVLDPNAGVYGRWFAGGVCNTCWNAVDRHVLRGRGEQAAIIYDKDGDQHYDVVSAFIKSVRGSDPNAALHYLARMLEAGEDPRFVARRLMILASEDIGMAEPSVLQTAVELEIGEATDVVFLLGERLLSLIERALAVARSLVAGFLPARRAARTARSSRATRRPPRTPGRSGPTVSPCGAPPTAGPAAWPGSPRDPGRGRATARRPTPRPRRRGPGPRSRPSRPRARPRSNVRLPN